MTRPIPFLVCILGACVEPTTPAPDQAEDRALMICGANTVASAWTDNGNRVMFCVHDGIEIVAETGEERSVALREAQEACALDVFLALTDDATPVPASLVQSCANITGVDRAMTRAVTAEPVFVALPGDDTRFYGADRLPRSFCTSTGEADFVRDECDWYTQRCGEDCASWCKSTPATSHVKTMSTTFGEAGNKAQATVASCDGTTRVRLLRDRGAEDDGWKTIYDLDAAANTAWWITSYYDGGFWKGYADDANFQFRGDSASGAWHRYGGMFEDY